MVDPKVKLSDLRDIRSHFPVFEAYPGLVYLDNAATTQRPESVIRRLDEFYRAENATVRRGVYRLSAQATRRFDQAREMTAQFFRAPDAECIAFTQGTTESINVVARSVTGPTLKKENNIVVSLMEHHANFIPWQMLCQEKGAELRVIPVDDRGDLKMEEVDRLIDAQTSCVAITHVSNTLGTINPIAEIINLAHQKGVPVLLDAAQSAALYPIDLTDLGVDFLACSGHKMFGPFGVGILYVHPRYRDQVRPYNYGGGIVRSVTVDRTEFLPYPFNLEAGTPHVAGVIGLAEAIRFLQSLDRTAILSRLHELTRYGREQLSKVGGVKMLGDPRQSGSVLSFSVSGIHPHDIATFLSEEDIAVRAGQHCTQPLLDFYGLPATVRASPSVYNTHEDLDRLVATLKEIIAFWT